MARGDAFMRVMAGVPTGKVDPMAENENENEGAEGTEGAGSGSTDAPTPEEIEALRQENETLRKAENTRRTEAARAAKAKADADRKAAQESGDAEALKAQLAAAETSNAELLKRVQVTQARAIAKELGAVDPKVVARLVDFDKMADPLDEDEVTSVIEALLREKKYLKGNTVRTDAGAGGGGNVGEMDVNTAIRRAAGRA